MIGASWLATIVLAAAFLGVLAVGEALGARMGVPAELTRKLDHAAAGLVALAVPLLFDSPGPVLVLAGAFLAFLLATRLTGRLGSVHGIARRTAGAYLYPVALAATWLATQDHPERYAVAILSLSLADAAGGLVGERWGRSTYTAWGQLKTWEGSLATLGVTAGASIAVLLASGLAPVEAFLAGGFVAVIVAAVEGSLPFGLDNLGVPLAAVAAMAALASSLAVCGVLTAAVAVFCTALVVPSPVPRIRRRPATARAVPGAWWR